MPESTCAERTKPGYDGLLARPRVRLLVPKNHFAALTRSFDCDRFSHLRNLHPRLVDDLVHHFVIVIGIVMEQQEPLYVASAASETTLLTEPCPQPTCR